MHIYLPSLKPSKLDEQDVRYTVGEVRANSYATFTNEPLHTDMHVLAVQQGLMYNSFVRTYTGCSLVDLPKAMGDRDE